MVRLSYWSSNLYLHSFLHINFSFYAVKDNVVSVYLIQAHLEKQEKYYKIHLEFREQLQQCEYWILQMSLRLMEHNTLNVSTLELTQEQRRKHQVNSVRRVATSQGKIRGIEGQGKS